MTAGNERYPAHDNQRIFRAILLTMSQPGSVTALGNWPNPPENLHPAAAAVCLTLVDMDTPLWIGKNTPNDIQTYLRFHCGCPVVRKQDRGAFGLILDGNDLPDLSEFNMGDIEYPDRSATLIIQVKDIQVGSGVLLTGPGINGQVQIGIEGLDTSFWQFLQHNNRQFPLGVDVILATQTEIVSLPRTVQVGI
ncbi:Alpha-D-ribose 1-methylphosphonate 5-triphosphate synthase subunit PhnH [Pseudodesulfovibrio profundus]|uniref:Alpha-D-ribose 1-methylphosphonate 5-triphosphate synthase subunit PhnH n=1 Tax=Pseudodesulfovibrio profundus TaxID=57320 RepID=A0A2C8FCR0_9BACT|nr:phosphonate C-P lyase system protein PhnH [Pseudodesulfovibrio profundus]SOB60274.1 Alpha-D-ribose 1-methylphosphonate 5-triphosphate synthase subunit PhnH [Pseudodesulfovibrio profundus]